MRIRWTLLLLLSLGLVAGRAAEPGPRKVRVEVEMVEVPAGEALRLLPQLRNAETFPAALARVQELVKSGEAEVLGWPVVQMESGAKTTSESREAIRFSIEFYPPAIPCSFPPITLYTLLPRRFDVPTAVDSREAGSTLEAEAMLDEQSGLIDLQIRATCARYEAMEPVIGARAQRPAGDQIPQPRIRDLQISAALTLTSGEQLLLDSFHFEAPQPRTVFFFLRVTAPPPLPTQP